MAIEPTVEPALSAQRSNFLNKIGNSAQGSQSANNQAAVNNVAAQVGGPRDDEDEKERRS